MPGCVPTWSCHWLAALVEAFPAGKVLHREVIDCMVESMAVIKQKTRVNIMYIGMMVK